MPDNFKVQYSKENNTSNEMVYCQFFKTSYLNVTQPILKGNDKDSFMIYICVEGELSLSANGMEETLKTGETILLPASISNYEINAKNAKLLEVYV